jgi:hypothetical protein
MASKIVQLLPCVCETATNCITLTEQKIAVCTQILIELCKNVAQNTDTIQSVACQLEKHKKFLEYLKSFNRFE